MLNNFVNSKNFITKLSRIDPCEKHVNILDGQHWRNFLMAYNNLVTMAIYVVKQAWCNDILPSMYYPISRYMKTLVSYAPKMTFQTQRNEVFFLWKSWIPVFSFFSMLRVPSVHSVSTKLCETTEPMNQQHASQSQGHLWLHSVYTAREE